MRRTGERRIERKKKQPGGENRKMIKVRSSGMAHMFVPSQCEVEYSSMPVQQHKNMKLRFYTTGSSLP